MIPLKEAQYWRDECWDCGMKVVKSFYTAPLKLLAYHLNGAGAKGYDWLVPDSILGLCITAAAQPHDWSYFKGQILRDKQRADWCFLYNMMKLRKQNPAWMWGVDYLRKRVILLYYNAVKEFGDESFMRDKVRKLSRKKIATPND